MVAVVVLAVTLASCGHGPSKHSLGGRTTGEGIIRAVGVESQYANIIGQLGGNYVKVSSIINNPNSDPHSFEANPAIAQEIASASLVVQNGLGYDSFANKMESAVASATRKIIQVQAVLGLPNSTPNPHLWYDPSAMVALARKITTSLVSLDPKYSQYFQSHLNTFLKSLGNWNSIIDQLSTKFSGAQVATTEPVADYLLEAAHLDNRTPMSFQEAIMNGTDPSPQDLSSVERLLTQHQVKALVYNEQVTDSITSSLQSLAKTNHIPVVGVYEIMPLGKFNFQSWMVAETKAIYEALFRGVSTEHL